MKVGVLGSGIMGNGIAQVFATGGFYVVLVDIKEDYLEKAKQIMKKNIKKTMEKQGRAEEAENVFNRITFSLENKNLKDADIIIEAIAENMELKKKVFKELDSICSDRTIFATNTSSLSVTELGGVTNRPDRVCGMHFFNPAPVMKLVEVVKGENTSNETVSLANDLTDKINKTAITAIDSPLFVVNRILVPMISEAIFVLDEGIATAEDIDEGMKLGANHPIGPLKLADMIGLDTLLFVQESLYHETGDSKYRVPYLLKRMVRAGNYGRKSGKGFYDYT